MMNDELRKIQSQDRSKRHNDWNTFRDRCFEIYNEEGIDAIIDEFFKMKQKLNNVYLRLEFEQKQSKVFFDQLMEVHDKQPSDILRGCKDF